LLEGPKTEAALPVFPPDTTLRQLWVRDDGNAYADFSEELMGATSGGSSGEILTVYAIVDSLTENVPAIRRVGILVSGRERATFGHLDLSRPLPPDITLVAKKESTE
jgi:spore germination protein GerM